MGHDYGIGTQYQILKSGKPIDMLNIKDSMSGLSLKLKYCSDIPFVIEIGMIDNYHQNSFMMKNNGKYNEDKIFVINLPQTNNEMVDKEFDIKLCPISNENHDIIFFIHNRTKAENNSFCSYDFLRLFIEGDNENSLLTEENKISFNEKHLRENMLELDPIFDEDNRKNCELNLNIEKIYLGECFRPAYDENKSKDFIFIVLAIQDNQLIDFKQSSFIWSETTLGKSGSINVEFNKKPTTDSQITLVTINYPSVNPLNIERYKLLAYNSISYYQYDFNNPVEVG